MTTAARIEAVNTLATVLLGLYDHGPATVSDAVRVGLERLIMSKGKTPTGLSRAMGKSHTWALRKVDPTQPQSRACTLGDVAEILDFLGATPQELLDACI